MVWILKYLGNTELLILYYNNMKRHGNPNTLIHQLTYENHMLRTQNNEIQSILIELQKEVEILKHKQNDSGILKLLQDKNTELNRELIKKNKQIAMLLNNSGSLITEMNLA